MTTMTRSAKAFALCLCVAALAAVPVTILGQIPTDSWPSYHGDYSGRRFSTLKQINTTNVKGLSLAWVYRLNTSRTGASDDVRVVGNATGTSPASTMAASGVG
jgi:glucose dehydrogenase